MLLCAHPCVSTFIFGWIHLCAESLPVRIRITWFNFHFYEQSSYLCQRDWWREVCWINVIVPLACQGACPLCYCLPLLPLTPSPTYQPQLHVSTLCHRYTISHHFTFSPHYFSPVDRIHCDIWRAHQQFPPLTLQTASLQRPKHNLEVT